ncbi:PPOX class F420-dependent oxidoreductase [Streptomyces sp. VRA16 Mangrove soil]|uniref:PPOX class F420-dependent oxidoreductase n=1 Tax=Streptomyces sp. VRA16 Mangrove soil TaxID=2817434 RepID=UPI001A9F27FC|nr:PPOX class F420-dependent oxidoreductase [Streptomyces sp. VRA16 Mangrove soil]MBO1332823.1 PPOX class F420-dependent oxidoreductase [Streptomyces sp. VRA16 Mangrove soil]
MSDIEAIRRAKYISLTTYRKDGTAVATPVWQVGGADGTLLVVTPAHAWKVKRIRNNGAVTVAVCTVRGHVAPGAAVLSGNARLLDEAGTADAQRLLAKKYLSSRIGNGFLKLFRVRRKPMAGIAITL